MQSDSVGFLTLTRRQFLAAILMLLVACCLLSLERLREWWKSVSGREVSAFVKAMQVQMDAQYEAFGRQMSPVPVGLQPW